MVVEDPFVRRFVAGVFRREGRPVIEAEMEDALRILREDPAAVSLLVTNRPWRFLEFTKTLRLIYIAAFPDAELAACFDHCCTLSKPFLPADLTACAAELALEYAR